MTHLHDKDLLHSRNHGYRKHHGTITAILEAQEEAFEAMERGEVMGIVTLDQSAAFDVIEHCILDRKLKLYGFDPHALGWFRSYLRNRSQYVALETSESEEKVVGPFACPQGSCLGPLLFLVTNDIFLATSIKLKFFTEDAYLSYQHCDSDHVNIDINMELRKIDK